MLHWKTDPLLLDSNPVEHTQWVTANQLLEQGKREKIFFAEDDLNLYGIFVRKQDFVTKRRNARIMTRMPYVQLNTTQVAFIQTHLEGVARRVKAYFEDSISMKLRDVYTRIQTGLKQRRLPLPILRVAATFANTPQELLRTWLKKTTYESFKHLSFKCPIQVTPALAYFLGVCDGDGSLTEKFVNVLTCSRGFTKRLLELSTYLFGKTSKITNSQGYDVIFIKSKWVVRLVHFLTAHPFGWKYDHLRQPRILDDTLACDYWRGAVDSDGTYVTSITWATRSERSRSNQPLSIVQIRVRSFLEFSRKIGTWHPEKTEQLYRLLKDGTKVLLFYGPNPSTMINQDYFNLELLPKLLTEVNGRITRVKHMLKLLGERIFEYLIINNAKFVYPRADNSINLPLKPYPEVNEVLKYVTPTRSGIAVTIGKHRGLKPVDLKEIVRQVSELFGISSLRKSNGGYHARHKLIRDFLRTFYLYKQPWSGLTHWEFEKLKTNWNPIYSS